MKTLNTLIAAGIAVAATAGAASASNIYSSDADFSGTSLEIATVVADAPASLVIYDYSNGTRGDVLGDVMLRSGLSSDVSFQLNSTVVDDVQAELTVNGVVVDTETFTRNN
ncbi:hypothetical protein [Celeribacter sp.]|uniref:hypothetical protein n=1 Tax=Celeribacter sp. TaxID=1890673 RepID=UPI003A924E73